MCETILTFTTTAVVGVLIFVVSQYVLKLVLEPMARVRRAIADVSSITLFKQRKIINATRDVETSEELWRVAAQLAASAEEVHCYGLFFRLVGVPSKKDVLEACRQLNLLAYGTHPSEEALKPENNVRALKKLGELLNTVISYQDVPG